MHFDQISCARLGATRKLKEKLNFSKNPSKSAIQVVGEQVAGVTNAPFNSFVLNCIGIGIGIVYSSLIEESSCQVEHHASPLSHSCWIGTSKRA